jgi:hypothetical protein
MIEAIPPLPPYVFMAWYLVKHRDKFTSYVKKKFQRAGSCEHDNEPSVP